MRTTTMLLGLLAGCAQLLPGVAATDEDAPPAADLAAAAFVRLCLAGVLGGQAVSHMVEVNQITKAEDESGGRLKAGAPRPFIPEVSQPGGEGGAHLPSVDDVWFSLRLSRIGPLVRDVSDVPTSLFRAVGADGVIEVTGGDHEADWCTVRMFHGEPGEAERQVAGFLSAQDRAFALRAVPGSLPARASGEIDMGHVPGAVNRELTVTMIRDGEDGAGIAFAARPAAG